MASIVMTKADVLDDAIPVGSPAGRVFAVPAFMSGNQTGLTTVTVEILTAAGVTVADGTYSISLWLKLLGVWTQIGPTLVGIARGEKVALPFGDLAQDTEGYFRITSIAGTAPNHVKLVADLMQAEVKGPTNALGYPYVESVGAGGGALAKEATQLLVEGHVSTIDTSTASIDGKLPAAAAPADGASNAENATSIRARIVAFNGATWDRIRTGLTGTLTSATGVLNNLGLIKYNATRPVLLDTNLTELQGNSRGDLAVAEQNRPQSQDDTNRVVWVMSRVLNGATTLDPTAGAWSVGGNVGASGGLGLAASWVIKAAPGVFGKLELRLDATAPSSTYYVHVINASALPADGAVTHLIAPRKIVHNVGFDDSIEYDAAPQWVWASTGIVVYLSTTEFAKTIAGAYLSGTVYYG